MFAGLFDSCLGEVFTATKTGAIPHSLIVFFHNFANYEYTLVDGSSHMLASPH